ncbi:MAG: PHB depolymerase family esterase [Kineosporiaceae bacterium]
MNPIPALASFARRVETRRRRRLIGAGAAGVLVAAMAVGVTQASAATLTQVTSFGSNPSNLRMYWYVPARVAAKPALLVLLHSCQGSAAYAANGLGPEYISAADRYGYIVVRARDHARSGACWDVHSAQALKRGGSDPVGIMSMVDYARSSTRSTPTRSSSPGSPRAR